MTRTAGIRLRQGYGVTSRPPLQEAQMNPPLAAPEELNVYSLVVNQRAKLHRSGISLISVGWFENVPLIEWNFMPIQEFQIFFVKYFSAVVLILILNVTNHGVQM